MLGRDAHQVEEPCEGPSVVLGGHVSKEWPARTDTLNSSCETGVVATGGQRRASAGEDASASDTDPTWDTFLPPRLVEIILRDGEILDKLIEAKRDTEATARAHLEKALTLSQDTPEMAKAIEDALYFLDLGN